MFLLTHSSSLSRSFFRVALPSEVFTSPLNLISLANFVRVHLTTSSRSLMKIPSSVWLIFEDPTCGRLSVWKGDICHHPWGANAPPIAWTSCPDHNTSTSLGSGKLRQKPWRNPGRQCPLLIPHQPSSSLCCRRWSGLSSTTCPWWMKTRNKDSDGNWYCMGSVCHCHGLGLIFPNSVFPVKHSKLCTDCSLSSPPLLPPVVGWKGELGAQKAKIMGWDMSNLLERARRLFKINNNSNNTNNRLHKKQTIHTQVLTPKKT